MLDDHFHGSQHLGSNSSLSLLKKEKGAIIALYYRKSSVKCFRNEQRFLIGIIGKLTNCKFSAQIHFLQVKFK